MRDFCQIGMQFPNIGGACRAATSPRAVCKALGFALLLFLFSESFAATKADSRISYNRDIRPILSDNCFYCHGPDPNKRKAKMRLDIREEALKREAFVPGQPDKSE